MLEELSQLPEIWDVRLQYLCGKMSQGLKPVEVLIGLRNILVEEGVIQPTARDALESIFRRVTLINRGRPVATGWRPGCKNCRTWRKVDNLIFVCVLSPTIPSCR